MTFEREFEKKNGLLFYADPDNNSFAVLQDGSIICRHIFSCYKRGEEMFCRENGEFGFKPLEKASVEGIRYLEMAQQALGIAA